jgi:DNA-binding MarR family transcriptional regulator
MEPKLLPSLICTAMMRVGTRMATMFDQHFAAMGITQAQFRTLLAIREAGPEGLAPSVLAEQLMLERATVTVLTARLVERGLLQRGAGENRRTFRLTLLPAGEELLERVIPYAVTLADATLEGHSSEELEAIWRSLQAIEERVRTYTERRVPMPGDPADARPVTDGTDTDPGDPS